MTCARLIDTVEIWQGEGVEFGGPWSSDVWLSTRPAGAVMLAAADGRLAGSVSGGCVEGAAFEQIEGARAADRARVIRCRISDEQAWDVAWPVAARSMSWSSRGVRPEIIAAARDAGVCVAIPLPEDAPPAEFGPVPPGLGRPSPEECRRGADGPLTGSLGSAGADSRVRSAALTRARPGRVGNDPDRGPAGLPGGLPGQAPPGRSRRRRGGPLPGALRHRPRLRDDRDRRPGASRQRRLPHDRSADRGLARRVARRDRPRRGMQCAVLTTT